MFWNTKGKGLRLHGSTGKQIIKDDAKGDGVMLFLERLELHLKRSHAKVFDLENQIKELHQAERDRERAAKNEARALKEAEMKAAYPLGGKATYLGAQYFIANVEAYSVELAPVDPTNRRWKEIDCNFELIEVIK